MKMRRITLWLVGTVCGLVLLFSYRTSTMGATQDPAHAAARPGIVGNAPPAATAAPNGSAAPGGQDTVVNGSVAQTRWGPFQVQVRISGGKIVEITTLQVPSGNQRDQEINSYAVPQLRTEVLAAQSAQIDLISGATYTSEAYATSLQAALDQARA
jgi:uncharacterized protein with FMN-binding domain